MRAHAPLGLLRACHPAPTAAVTAAATLLALAGGRPAGQVAAAVLASQLAVGWHNDWWDADRDATVGRRDKPIPAGAVPRRVVGVAALLAAVATPPLALLSGPGPALAATVGLGAALLYNWPLKNTALSVLPWLVSFGLLPVFVLRGGPAWLVAAAALLGGGAHFVNALPDLADDARTGVRGLPHRLGATGSRVAAAAGLLAASALLVLGPPGPPSWWGWVALGTAAVGLSAGLLYAVRRPRSRAPFHAVLLVALVDVVLLLAAGRPA